MSSSQYDQEGYGMSGKWWLTDIQDAMEKVSPLDHVCVPVVCETSHAHSEPSAKYVENGCKLCSDRIKDLTWMYLDLKRF